MSDVHCQLERERAREGGNSGIIWPGGHPLLVQKSCACCGEDTAIGSWEDLNGPARLNLGMLEEESGEEQGWEVGSTPE
jgi:hypothetical protein